MSADPFGGDTSRPPSASPLGDRLRRLSLTMRGKAPSDGDTKTLLDAMNQQSDDDDDNATNDAAASGRGSSSGGGCGGGGGGSVASGAAAARARTRSKLIDRENAKAFAARQQTLSLVLLGTDDDGKRALWELCATRADAKALDPAVPYRFHAGLLEQASRSFSERFEIGLGCDVSFAIGSENWFRIRVSSAPRSNSTTADGARRWPVRKPLLVLSNAPSPWSVVLH